MTKQIGTLKHSSFGSWKLLPLIKHLIPPLTCAVTTPDRIESKIRWLVSEFCPFTLCFGSLGTKPIGRHAKEWFLSQRGIIEREKRTGQRVSFSLSATCVRSINNNMPQRMSFLVVKRFLEVRECQRPVWISSSLFLLKGGGLGWIIPVY